MKQRKGRLGRTTPGEYYFVQYNDFDSNKMEHDLTEIERIDLTNVLFEMIIKYEDYDKAIKEIERLNYKKSKEF